MKLRCISLDAERSRLHFYVHELENPSAGILVDERIVAAVRRLIDFPASGRVGRIAGTRELVINGTPYVAAYAISETAVRILRVLHGAQEWPDTLPTG